MVIIITLVILFILFFFIRKNIGPALLATIAGLSIHELFGKQLVEFIAHNFDNPNVTLIEVCVYLAFVFALPMMLYFRSRRGGLFGIMRIAEAVVYAALLASLCSNQISYFFPFDETATEIISFINSIKGWILVGGIAAAYLDILLSREA